MLALLADGTPRANGHKLKVEFDGDERAELGRSTSGQVYTTLDGLAA